MEINQELKELGKFKEDGYQNITSKHLLAFIDALKSINELVILHYLMLSLISENGAALREQVIDFSIL